VFSRILTSALLAGAGAGLITALLQLVFVQPVLLHAELYESGTLQHFTGNLVSTDPALPGFDPLRDGLSILFTMLVYSGYAMILIAGMAMATDRGYPVNGRVGVIWGIAGFVAVHLAPAFSLPPEVPGVAAADVGARQIWWFATVIAAAIAMWLIGFGKTWVHWGAAAVLLAVPHLVGAPAPDAFTGPVPPELAAMFAARALGVGLAAWVLVGCFAGAMWQRSGDDPDKVR